MCQLKILSIDDDPEISSILHARLQPYHIDVLRAFSGMQGFWTAIVDRPSVIISDLVMPDGQGNYIFSRFQNHSLTKDIPFIVLTGQGNEAVKRSLLNLGVAAYLEKPFVFKDLLTELSRHIEIPDLHAGHCEEDLAHSIRDGYNHEFQNLDR
jgi:DNA-binding response OmpR family regulator